MTPPKTSNEPLGDLAFDQLFFSARSHNAWLKRDVPDELLRRLVDAMKMAPTSANCSPVRLVFVKSEAAKARLKPHLSDGNKDKTMAAPVCAIIGTDYEFYEKLPKLFPHTDARGWFFGSDGKALQQKIDETAFRNATLQGAYLIMAARALGLDCGPMSGFDPQAVTTEFFAESKTIKANFLCNIGYGDHSAIFNRSPRFDFGEIASIV
ncbi:MAG: malonic semialdehyde reductase [Pseudomonadota bacterium]